MIVRGSSFDVGDTFKLDLFPRPSLWAGLTARCSVARLSFKQRPDSLLLTLPYAPNTQPPSPQGVEPAGKAGSHPAR